MFKIFGKHYGAERFFALLFLMFGGIVALCVYAGSIQHELNQFRVGSTALYTSGYTWSRTSSTGKVVKLVANRNNTAAFLLIQNEDVGMTSTNADDYQIFMTGMDTPLSNAPAMTVYSFGLSGYVGFYFTDAKGFASQRYSLIIRADSAGSQMADESMFDKSVQDSSFRDHNQIRLVMNFGASGIEHLPVMDEPGLTPIKLMCDLNLDAGNLGLDGVKGYEGLQESAQKYLEEMNKSLISIAQYRATLDENNVSVPDLPYYMAGDAVNMIPNDFTKEPTVFDTSMLDAPLSGHVEPASNPTGSSALGATYKDGETVKNYLYLHTYYLFPGTTHVGWQGTRLSDGLLTQTAYYDGTQPMDDSYAELAALLGQWKTAYSDAMPTKPKYTGWIMKDGSYLDMQDRSGLNAQVISMIDKYVGELGTYLEAKSRYLQLQNSMLESEAAVQGLRKMIYSNNGSAVQNLWLY